MPNFVDLRSGAKGSYDSWKFCFIFANPQCFPGQEPLTQQGLREGVQ